MKKEEKLLCGRLLHSEDRPENNPKPNEQRQFFFLKAIIFMVTWNSHRENGCGVALLLPELGFFSPTGAESYCLQK